MLLRKPMKSLFLLVLTICCFSADATNYYVANSGNDSNNGTDPSTPWKTIDKVNSFTGFMPGDQILFRRGDTFYGSISVKQAGIVGNPIIYSAYGSGAKPTITGFTKVTSWTNKGGNIWESTDAVSTLADLKVVLINGVSTPMGRYPNADAAYPYFPNFFKFQSHTGDGSSATSITSADISGTTDWTGADVVVRVNQWTLDKETITSQSGNTINYVGQASTVADNWGFFIQNDLRTLDQQGEWYYNPSTKKLDIYSTSQPTDVSVSTIDTLFDFYSNVPTIASVTVDNLDFQGANTNGIWISGNLTFSITNCQVSYSGFEGIILSGGGIKSGTITASTCSNNGSGAIYASGDVKNLVITNNIIRSSGIVSIIKHNDYTNGGMSVYAKNSLIQYNSVDSSAYCGIEFRTDSVQVRNNFVDHSALVRGDAGGIYTGFANETGKVIDGNIILNSQGNPRGTRGNDYFANGIYIDDFGNHVSVTNNTIAYCRAAGLYIHNSNNLFIRNNTIYSCGALGTETIWANGGISVDGNANQFANSTHDNKLLSNIVFATNQYQYGLNYYAASGAGNEVSNFGTIDSNYYVKLNSSATAIRSQQNNIDGNMGLSEWQSLTGKDLKSKDFPQVINEVKDIRFLYNPTKLPKTIALDAIYIDVKGNAYNGSITLASYSSVVLIRNGALTNSSPTANAGKDTSITLPADSVFLSGTGTDSNGSISKYLWRKVFGPSSYAISDSTSASTTVNGLIQGIYNFELTVTDNKGATGKDTVQIKVNSASNIPPTANAGKDQTIALPANSVNLSGTGTDSDGSISKYLWRKVSGPSSYKITDSTSASTAVNGLIQGIYNLELTVTDNREPQGKTRSR